MENSLYGRGIDILLHPCLVISNGGSSGRVNWALVDLALCSLGKCSPTAARPIIYTIFSSMEMTVNPHTIASPSSNVFLNSVVASSSNSVNFKKYPSQPHALNLLIASTSKIKTLWSTSPHHYNWPPICAY